MESAATLAARLARARAGSLALPAFPGDVPSTPEAAYDVQQKAIRLWKGKLGGWKVGNVRPEWRDAFHDVRFVGPIFCESIHRVLDGKPVEIPLVLGGFGAVEAELVVELAVDLPPRDGYTVEELEAAIGRIHIGAEVAGSAVPDIVALGPCAIVADFGVNRGLVVGPEVRDWRSSALSSVHASLQWHEGNAVHGSAATLPGGVIGALTGCLDLLRAQGRGLKGGDLVSTGAICSLRPLQPGKCVVVTFDDLGKFEICFGR